MEEDGVGSDVGSEVSGPEGQPLDEAFEEMRNELGFQAKQ